jgi:hypothetical protein
MGLLLDGLIGPTGVEKEHLFLCLMAMGKGKDGWGRPKIRRI